MPNFAEPSPGMNGSPPALIVRTECVMAWGSPGPEGTAHNRHNRHKTSQNHKKQKNKKSSLSRSMLRAKAARIATVKVAGSQSTRQQTHFAVRLQDQLFALDFRANVVIDGFSRVCRCQLIGSITRYCIQHHVRWWGVNEVTHIIRLMMFEKQTNKQTNK